MRIALRALAPVMVVLGGNYLVWRSRESIDWSSWLGVAVFIAEVVSFVDAVLFAATVCRQVRRSGPRRPAAGTVDVFITTYDEPVELVLETALAARRIAYPHQTWILDDGARPRMRQVAEDADVGYLTRDDAWRGKPRHAKAGNLIDALARTDGEFVLVLDADQIPDPAILDRTLGYFADNPDLAFVQTPQWFSNVGEGDILGAQAELFYGPLMRGKDGWGAAYFCGSNAVLRREALAQYGLSEYSAALRRRVTAGLRHAGRRLRRRNPTVLSRAENVVLRAEVRQARRAIARGAPVVDATAALQRSLVELRLSRRACSDVLLTALTEALRVDRPEEARAVLPLATTSVTEDMATAVELHARGWTSVYHDEVLARGLAPTDLTGLARQRLRWAQGTIQVLFAAHPLTRRGLTFGQRIMYAATIWSYLAGALALVYLLTPIMFLGLGVPPLHAKAGDFLWHFLPYFAVNILFAAIATRGTSSWRGQQYATALFPVWIAAWASALLVTILRRPIRFRVTPKVARTARTRDLVTATPQLLVVLSLCAAVAVGVVRAATGTMAIEPAVFATVWAIYDVVLLSVVIRAAVRPPALRAPHSRHPDWSPTLDEHSTRPRPHLHAVSTGGHRRSGPPTGPHRVPRPSRSRRP